MKQAQASLEVLGQEVTPQGEVYCELQDRVNHHHDLFLERDPRVLLSPLVGVVNPENVTLHVDHLLLISLQELGD